MRNDPGRNLNRRSQSAPGSFAPDTVPRRKLPRWLVVSVLVVLAAFLFLRGPNGLIRMVGRWQRVKAAEAELIDLRREIDSLQAVKERFGDTVFIRRYAVEVMSEQSPVAPPEPAPAVESGEGFLPQEEVPEPDSARGPGSNRTGRPVSGCRAKVGLTP